MQPKSQARCWLQRDWKKLLKDVFMLTVPPIVFLYIAFFFGLVTVLAKDAILTSLIEAEATVFGFFGLIVVYILKSLDDREHRYYQMLFDLEMEQKGKDPKSVFLRSLTTQIHKQKEATIRFARTIGVSLLSSILLSILILGIPNVVLAGLLSIIAVYLFLVSIVSILWMFSDIAKTKLRYPPFL